MKWIKYILFLFILLELTSFISLKYLSNNSNINLVYKPLEVDIEEYLKTRDAITGWPSTKLLQSKHYSAKGTRINPYEVNNKAPFIQIFGDSFTRGAEVTNKECWSNLLSKQINENVDNFGVDGFGTDQAFLRFKTKKDTNAELYILGFTSDNIMRNVNSYRNMISAAMDFPGFKPRYRYNASEGVNKLIELQGNNKTQSVINNPKVFLQDDYFAQSEEGPTYIKWPFSISFAKLFNHYLINSKLSGEAFYSSFFDPEHPSQALDVTAQIMVAFQTECENEGHKSLVLLFPQIQDFKTYYDRKEWNYQSLINILEKKDIKYLNLGGSFLEIADFQTTYPKFFAKHGHYNYEGNKVVASKLNEYLNKNSIFTTTYLSK